ncbi:DUF692 domain-containing protein [Vibrio sp. TBV020]|uniref:DUF692 domain-containing protein n=1 Tax=Vibrio sp. TBV020 TaxID=3137398 RepID=UPI0038CD5A14
MRSIATTAKGLGLRSEHFELLANSGPIEGIDFLELAPENWMNIGGVKKDLLSDIAKKYPLVAHGLSLSIADTMPLNTTFVKQVGRFLDEHNISIYSEHLSLSRDKQGYLYELLPVPRRKENIAYLADRINQVQDIISRPLVLENISYYHDFGDEIPEGEFLAELVEKSDCQLLVDINNAYVNSHNHGFDVFDMINSLPSDAIRYYHIAGHLTENDSFLLDTHGASVQDQVIELAKYTYSVHGAKPLLLERDNNVPPLGSLVNELNIMHAEILDYAHALKTICEEVIYA